jgi:DNA (cytosine-5)-methyltransferase 1
MTLRMGELFAGYGGWMQGLDDGWVTGVPGISRNDQLKALGNGVVPQQAAEAARRLIAPLHARRAA